MFMDEIISQCRALFFKCTECQSRLNQFIHLCDSCALSLLKLNHCFCQRCGLALKQNYPLCGPCIAHPPAFDRLTFCGDYTEVLKQRLQQFKFSANLSAGRMLADLLIYQIKKNPLIPKPDGIVAMPLHYKRLRQRGFNQALEIAKPIAKALKIPLIRHAIKRVVNTQPQARLAHKDRLNNVKNAFKIKTPLPKNIAIIDDVVTTGATVNQLAKLCKQQGADNITVWCVCRRQLNI